MIILILDTCCENMLLIKLPILKQSNHGGGVY